MMTSSSDIETKCYIWYDQDLKYLPQVINYIKDENQCCKEILHLCANDNSQLKIQSLLNFMLQMCRKYNALQNNLTTFLPNKDYLLALQLCTAFHNKKESGKFTEDLMNVAELHSSYKTMNMSVDNNAIMSPIIKEYHNLLCLSNSTDEWTLFSSFRKVISDNSNLKNLLSKHILLISGMPTREIHMKILSLLTTGKDIIKLCIELPLDASLHESLNEIDINIVTEPILLQDLIISKTELVKISATEEYVKEICIAFLRLLFNCRDEIALARALISPIIGLSHTAFTDLKRISIEKKMPMCQTAISYITRMQLGGKSYAPDKNCPLHQHSKGLQHFVNFLHQLQTVVEDLPPMLCFKRIINLIKNRLLKESQLKKGNIEQAAENIIQLSIKLCPENATNSVIPVSSVQTTEFLCHLVDCISSQNNRLDVEDLFYNMSENKTPLNLPNVFSYFKSPEEIENNLNKTDRKDNHKTNIEGDSCKSIKLKKIENIFEKTKSSNEVNKENCSSKCQSTPILGKTNKQRRSECTEENSFKKLKRCIFDDVTNVSSKQPTVLKKKVQKAKKPKELPKGQKNITNFFLLR